MTAVFSACAVCPFPETCEEFGLCEDPSAGQLPDAAERAAAITGELDALPDRDVRQFLAGLAAADPDALEEPLIRFLAERASRRQQGQ
ncbi:MAG TPA: hypothetical protein VGH88_00525 [Streptosporangiaceae bacterium]|jgi:hypothetical protein